MAKTKMKPPTTPAPRKGATAPKSTNLGGKDAPAGKMAHMKSMPKSTMMKGRGVKPAGGQMKG
jgi:hypothetical protein